jgi:hypothetical protein
MVLTGAACAGGEVVLEIRVRGGRIGEPLEGGPRERGAAEVRVHDHARRVQHASERGAPRRGERGVEARVQVAGIGAGTDLLARAGDHVARCVDRERVVAAACELVNRRQIT